MMKIKVQKNDLFETWLKWYSPRLPLKYLERKVLSAYLTMHYFNMNRFSSNEKLHELLMSDDTKKMISKKLEITVPRLERVIQALTDKGCFENQMLNKALTNYPKNNKFQIHVDFEII